MSRFAGSGVGGGVLLRSAGWFIALAFCVPVVEGGFTGAFVIEAVSSNGSGSIVVNLNQGVWGPGTWSWSSDQPVPIMSGSKVIGTCLNASVALDEVKREIQLGIGVTAGNRNTDFRVATPLVSFPTLSEEVAAGAAIATVDLTETQGLGGDAWVYGDPPGMGVYRAQYAGGTRDFRSGGLVGLVQASDGGTVSVTERDPGFGYRLFGDEVSDLRSLLDFTLTADDLLYATTEYGVVAVPEPGGALLLFVVGAVAMRRSSSS